MSTPDIRVGNKIQIFSVSAGLDIPQSQEKPEGKKTFGQCIVSLRNSNHYSVTLIKAGVFVAAGGAVLAACGAGTGTIALFGPMATCFGIVGGGVALIGAGWLVCAALKNYCSKDNRHQSISTPTPNGVEGYDNQGLDSGDADTAGGGSGGKSVADNGETSDMTMGQDNSAYESDEGEDAAPPPTTRKRGLNLQKGFDVKSDSELRPGADPEEPIIPTQTQLLFEENK